MPVSSPSPRSISTITSPYTVQPCSPMNSAWDCASSWASAAAYGANREWSYGERSMTYLFGTSVRPPARMALCASASRCMALRISTGWTTPLKTLAKAPSTRPSRRFSKRCSTLTGSSSGPEDMMVSVDRTPVCTPDGHLVLLFRGVSGHGSASLRAPGAGGPEIMWCRNSAITVPHSRLPGEVAEWQTRTVQVRVPERAWGFNSPLPHQPQGPPAVRRAFRYVYRRCPSSRRRRTDMSVAVVTGSAGLVGSEAVRHFAGLGLHVVGIDNDMRREFFGPEASTAWNVVRLT